MLDTLRCPQTGSRLHPEGVTTRDGEHLMDGSLVAEADNTLVYPIFEGVPNLLPEAASQDAAQTLEVFGSEWSDFAD